MAPLGNFKTIVDKKVYPSFLGATLNNKPPKIVTKYSPPVFIR